MIKIYTNESVNVAITKGLKRRGIEAWSARDAGNLGMTDEEQLRYACEKESVIVTVDSDLYCFRVFDSNFKYFCLDLSRT